MRVSNEAADRKGGRTKARRGGRSLCPSKPGKAGDEPFDQAAGVRHERHDTDLWLEMRLFKEWVDYNLVTLS
jgi:hypothetical protein